jgi:spore germination protein GerM
MKPSQWFIPALVALAAVGLAWQLFVRLPNRYAADPAPSASAGTATPAATQGRNIKAQLFYVGDDGASLKAVEREIPFGENTAEQAKAIVGAQVGPPTEALVSAIPPGTTLRALFITRGGEAYVDLSRELVTAHPGGSTNELLTIRTLVDVLTTNLPAITAVQLLVDGKELDTLAGHVDLRRPFTRKVQ